MEKNKTEMTKIYTRDGNDMMDMKGNNKITKRRQAGAARPGRKIIVDTTTQRNDR